MGSLIPCARWRQVHETQELDTTDCSAAGTELPRLSCMGCGPLNCRACDIAVSASSLFAPQNPQMGAALAGQGTLNPGPSTLNPACLTTCGG